MKKACRKLNEKLMPEMGDLVVEIEPHARAGGPEDGKCSPGWGVYGVLPPTPVRGAGDVGCYWRLEIRAPTTSAGEIVESLGGEEENENEEAHG